MKFPFKIHVDKLLTGDWTPNTPATPTNFSNLKFLRGKSQATWELLDLRFGPLEIKDKELP